MTEKTTHREILVKSENCHGCLTCQLHCSLRVTGMFNPSKAYIRVDRTADGFAYEHDFTDGCDGCGGDYLCIRWCPYGALGLGGN